MFETLEEIRSNLANTSEIINGSLLVESEVVADARALIGGH